jgi:methylase of polypeptide subunit release factors
MFDEEVRYAVNVFDWRAEFPHVMAAGGFDAVIGNPPYLNVDDTWGSKDPRLAALKHQYPEVYTWTMSHFTSCPWWGADACGGWRSRVSARRDA